MLAGVHSPTTARITGALQGLPERADVDRARGCRHASSPLVSQRRRPPSGPAGARKCAQMAEMVDEEVQAAPNLPLVYFLLSKSIVLAFPRGKCLVAT